MPDVILFDVNETLLDLSALDPAFEAVFGDARHRGDWFKQVLQSALVSVAVDQYRDFSTLGRTALDMVAERLNVPLGDDDRERILGTVRALPPHDDVADSLSRLQDAGFRLAALTNGLPGVAHPQLEHAGLASYFEAILSVDAAKRLKPAPEPYHAAAETLGVEPGAICMVAAHAWDVTGAMNAGCQAAFVARPGKVFDPAFSPPAIMGRTMTEVCDQIIAATQR